MAFDKDRVKSDTIPADVVDLFFNFLEQSNTTVKEYFDVEGDVKLLTREVHETRPNDLKSSLALFEKLYPQYFDQLTIERLTKLKADTGTDELDKFKDAARKMLKVAE